MVEFGIKTGDTPPIAQHPYNTPVMLREGVEEEIRWLLDKGYIWKSCSEWASPIVTVRMPKGRVRLCVDFKRINAVTRPLPFYKPKIEEVLEAVGPSTVISKLDLSKGYYQVPMWEQDIPKTAFVCYKEKIEFLRMPFGVRNTPAVFQTIMDTVLEGKKAAYIDYVIIYSSSWPEHAVHVREVLAALGQRV